MNNDIGLILLGGEPDATTGFRVFRGIREEVHRDLLKANRVRLHAESSGAEGDEKLVLPLLDERPDGVDGTVEYRADVDDFLAKLNFALADAGDVEQIVDEPGELFDLPLDDLRRPLERLVKFGLSCHEHGIADG